MALKCFLIVGLIIGGDLAKVRCAESSVIERISAYAERLHSARSTTAGSSTITPSNGGIENTTLDFEQMKNTTTTNEPKEFSTISASHAENTTLHEDFLKKETNSISEEAAALDLDLGQSAITDEEYFQNQDQVEDLSHPKLFTTLIDIEEESNMSFDKLASVFMDESEESNVDKKRRKERDQEAHIAELEDDIVETEFIKQDVKHKSLGIEPLAMIVLPERRPRPTLAAITTTPSIPIRRTQQIRTSYLLTSDTEIDRSPFLVKSKPSTLVELHGHSSNLTHEAAFYRKSAENTVYTVPTLTVDLSRDSNLLMNTNERQELAFEVTNNLNNAARVSFTVRDELGILLEIDRYVAILTAHATTTVKVAVLPKTGQTSDRITLIATASEQVRKEVIVDIEGNYRSDTEIPFVDYNYLSDCTDIVLARCQEGTWTIKITAKDSESGLKLLTTTPKGLYFPEGYVAGTREEVTGIYSESCCNADLEIVAIDRMNNRYVRQINAYRAPLSFWAVIAISLVSLIFLTIIVVSSLICLKKCKKNEADSFDLPTYRGGARTRY